MSISYKNAIVDEPSDFFVSTLNGGGGVHITCQCGIEHYCPETMYSSDYEDEETMPSWQEHCEKHKLDDPDGVMLHYGYDSVSYNEIDGKAFVYSCSCYNDGLAKYENWIWENRDILRKYLKARVDHEFKLAEHEKTMNILLEEHK
jgi:hypothetical protein